MAVLVSLSALAAIALMSCVLLLVALRRSDRATRATHLAGIGAFHDVGEIVALRVETTGVGRAREASRWYSRGRNVVITCDMVMEYRFDMRRALVTRRRGGIEVRMPPCDVTVSHGNIEVELIQAATVIGLPVRGVDEAGLSRMIAEARENVGARHRSRCGSLLARACENARRLLADYAGVVAPAEEVRIVFSDATAISDQADPGAALVEPACGGLPVARPRLELLRRVLPRKSVTIEAG